MIVAIVVSMIFLGMGVLVYLDRFEGKAIVFFGGGIVGYLVHVASMAISS